MTTPIPDTHWARQEERGNVWLMKLTVLAARKLGRGVMTPVIWVVTLYFYLFGPRARHAIKEYQQRLAQQQPELPLFPKRAPVYRQYLAFSDAILDKFAVWQNKIGLADLDIVDPDALHEQMLSGRGQILVGAHLGNLEICRALAQKNSRVVLNVLVHDKNAEHFNHLLAQANGSQLRLIQVTELDAGVLLRLSEALDRGEWIAMTGDRVPVHGARTVTVNFLGAPAAFAQGPWQLGGLLRCPINFLSCTKHAGRYRVHFERLTPGIEWTRATRSAQIQFWAQRYADTLASHCVQAPLQWFNFYPFWSNDA